jgi:hypothetical protein
LARSQYLSATSLCRIYRGNRLGRIRLERTGGWQDHIIRNNFVTNCGTCGIGGQYAHNSTISGNFVQDIAGRGYYGYEIAGIKVHQAQRLTISGNVVINVERAGLSWPSPAR